MLINTYNSNTSNSNTWATETTSDLYKTRNEPQRLYFRITAGKNQWQTVHLADMPLRRCVSLKVSWVELTFHAAGTVFVTSCLKTGHTANTMGVETVNSIGAKCCSFAEAVNKVFSLHQPEMSVGESGAICGMPGCAFWDGGTQLSDLQHGLPHTKIFMRQSCCRQSCCVAGIHDGYAMHDVMHYIMY